MVISLVFPHDIICFLKIVVNISRISSINIYYTLKLHTKNSNKSRKIIHVTKNHTIDSFKKSTL